MRAKQVSPAQANSRGGRRSIPCRGNRREEGYKSALHKHQMKMPESYVVSCGEASDSDGETRARRAMEEILVMRPRPDAIFCFNDTVAVGAMMRAIEAGLKIPKDLAIVGCGDFHYSSKLQVPLTSVDQRSREIGERTARMILSLMEKPSSTRPRSIVLTPQLIARASSLKNI